MKLPAWARPIPRRRPTESPAFSRAPAARPAVSLIGALSARPGPCRSVFESVYPGNGFSPPATPVRQSVIGPGARRLVYH